MRFDEYSREASLRRRRAQRSSARRRRTAGLLALALAGALAVGGTVAWLTSQSETVTNAFTRANVTTEIDEGFDGAVKKDVKIENTGDVPVYVRAKVVVSWVDGNGNVAANVPDGYGCVFKNASGAEVSGLDAQVGDGWMKGADGFWYYEKALKAKDDASASEADRATSALIASVEAKYPAGVAAADAEYHLSVEILSEAIQALPDEAFNDAWGVSSGLTAEDGKLTVTETPTAGE